MICKQSWILTERNLVHFYNVIPLLSTKIATKWAPRITQHLLAGVLDLSLTDEQLSGNPPSWYPVARNTSKFKDKLISLFARAGPVSRQKNRPMTQHTSCTCCVGGRGFPRHGEADLEDGRDSNTSSGLDQMLWVFIVCHFALKGPGHTVAVHYWPSIYSTHVLRGQSISKIQAVDGREGGTPIKKVYGRLSQIDPLFGVSK